MKHEYINMHYLLGSISVHVFEHPPTHISHTEKNSTECTITFDIKIVYYLSLF